MTTAELNQILIQKKLITAAKLTELEQEVGSSVTTEAWETFLVEKKVITESQLLELKSEQLGVPIVDLRDQHITPEVLSLVPEPVAHRHRIISFAKEGEVLSVAMIDPDDIQIKEFIKKKTGLELKPFLMSKMSWDFGLSNPRTTLTWKVKLSIW
jgi:hypothetical protein